MYVKLQGKEYMYTEDAYHRERAFAWYFRHSDFPNTSADLLEASLEFIWSTYGTS